MFAKIVRPKNKIVRTYNYERRNKRSLLVRQYFLKKIKMAGLESTDIPDSYVLPWQANIYAGRYPMIRDLVYILKEKQTGLGKGFANFLSGEQGQKIFWRAYLVPTQLDFTVRPTILNE